MRRSSPSIAGPLPAMISVSPWGVSSGRVTSQDSSHSRPRNRSRTAVTVRVSPGRTSVREARSDEIVATCEPCSASMSSSAERTRGSSNRLL